MSLRLLCSVLIVAFSVGAAPPRPVRAYTLTSNIPYRNVDGVTLRLDLYRPDAPGTYPAVVLIHGGGWSGGSKANMDVEGRRLAESGLIGVAIDYRKVGRNGGGWTAPAASDDAHAAVAWVRANASQYGINPAKVGALGPSAGGHLALMVGTSGTPDLDKADVVAGWSSPADLPNMPPNDDAPENYLGCSREACPQKWLDNSPSTLATSDDAPAYLAHSLDDRLVPVQQARTMSAALQAAGVEHQLRLFDGRAHGEGLRNQALGETVAFFKARL
jgi:acetyl esterase/lipase